MVLRTEVMFMIVFFVLFNFSIGKVFNFPVKMVSNTSKLYMMSIIIASGGNDFCITTDMYTQIA